MLKQALAILTLAAGPLAASTPALAEAPDFNGTWTVQLVTETGVCSGSSSYSVSDLVRDGRRWRCVAGTSGHRGPFRQETSLLVPLGAVRRVSPGLILPTKRR